jgi:hypothetical protein
MTLPVEVQEALIALADQGEVVWQKVAAITADLLEQDGAVRMRVYQDVAATLGMKGSGVRAWVGVYKMVGDDLLTEFPQYRFTHWRTFISAAAKTGRSVADLAMQYAVTEGDYAGMPIPPDALAAQLGNPRDNRDPYLKALDRAASAIATAQRHMPTEAPNRAAWMVGLRQAQDLVEKLVEMGGCYFNPGCGAGMVLDAQEAERASEPAS